MKVHSSIAALAVLLAPAVVYAGVTCADVKYGSPTYHDKMDELARTARLPDNYWSRYHEQVVAAICDGKPGEVKRLVDVGSVKAVEAQAIRKNLIVATQRSEAGKSYGYSRKKFSDMGLCSACADNIAQWYTKRPDSACGKLAKQALEGNPEAESTLATFPSYCEWKY